MLRNKRGKKGLSKELRARSSKHIRKTNSKRLSTNLALNICMLMSKQKEKFRQTQIQDVHERNTDQELQEAQSLLASVSDRHRPYKELCGL